MNKEEKAIEWLKKADWFSARLYVPTILNLIEKQQKGISLLKDQLEYVKSEYEKTIEHQQKEIEALKKENIEIRDWKYTIDTIEDLDKLKELDLIKIKGKEYISKDKIKAKIEELEKEQENNRKSLYNAINILYFKEIDKISNRISVNMAVQDILKSLLEEE